MGDRTHSATNRACADWEERGYRVIYTYGRCRGGYILAIGSNGNGAEPNIYLNGISFTLTFVSIAVMQTHFESQKQVGKSVAGHGQFSRAEQSFHAFHRTPSLTRINASNIRDSILTQNSLSMSANSSSLYPQSTSTGSGTESPPSPQSMALQEEQYGETPFGEHVDEADRLDELEEYEGDDVSYRLRLLVKNNYFLPPAHSKPSPSDFATAAAVANASKRPGRATTPTFLDLFRVGKSKSKSSTPPGTFQSGENLAPMLRTASDSPSNSAYIQHQQNPRTSLQTPRITSHSNSIPRQPVGRVVVVREKMSDITVAAKQAEQEMKNRNIRREQDTPSGPQTMVDIDPTDIVDVPPVVVGYPFAVQASALHGLGVKDSVGAALLAERLPPPMSPGVSTSSYEDSWRKALLQQAVHHSLDNTPDVSSFSVFAGSTSSPISTPRASNQTSSRGSSPGIKQPSRLLEQHISPKISESQPPSEDSHGQRKSSQSQRSNKTANSVQLAKPLIVDTSSRSSYLALRVDTPVAPMTPLTPPPRRATSNVLSQSRIDLVQTSEVPQPASAVSMPASMRRSKSTSILSDADEIPERVLVFTPPPLPMPLSFHRALSQEIFRSSSASTSFEYYHTPAQSTPSIITSDSRYSNESYAEIEPRASMALSAMHGNEHRSVSSHSQPSPISPMFPEALEIRNSISSRHPAHSVIERPASAGPRFSMSPPPRASSSVAHFALTPAPRPAQARAHIISPLSSAHIATRDSPTSAENVPQILAPEPTTPPLPISERRHNRIPPVLTIPTTRIPVAIHSAPGPSSPTNFFDTLQSQPNAMDDLESSDEDDEQHRDSSSLYGTAPPPPPIFVDPRPDIASPSSGRRPKQDLVMRLGNFSTPHVGRRIEQRRPSLPFGIKDAKDKDAKKPVGFIPTRSQFFAERKHENASGLSLALANYPHSPQINEGSSLSEHGHEYLTSLSLPLRPSSPISQRSVAPTQASSRTQESLKRLDGMLLQHMEAEKDTIKRIATTLRTNNTGSNPRT